MAPPSVSEPTPFHVTRFDPSTANVGAALLPSDEFDPLRAVEGDDYFWNYVDASFQPLNLDDAANFRALPPSSLGGAAHDSALALPAENVNSAINALPLTQRLVAALLDEGDTPAPAPAPGAQGLSAAALGAVATGSAASRKRHHEAMETRVSHELRAHGLIDPKTDDALVNAMRTEQWRLRELKAANNARQRAVVRNAIQLELREQPMRRQSRLHQDKIQMAYLERTLSRLKKNKKSRAKLHKLLQRNFGHYKTAERKNTASKATATATKATASKAATVSASSSTAPLNGAGVTDPARRSKGKNSTNAWRKKKRKSEGGGSAPAKKHASGKGGAGSTADKMG